MLKACSKCREEFPTSEFSKDRTREDGLHPWCKVCRRTSGTKYARRRRQDPDTREKQNITRKEWEAKNPDKVLAYRKRAYDKKTPDQNKDSFLRSTYGITLEDYGNMLAAQSGVCAICGEPETRRSRYGGVCRLHVDHDHATGKVRGLLCHLCNVALGSFKDNPELLGKAIAYLGK